MLDISFDQKTQNQLRAMAMNLKPLGEVVEDALRHFYNYEASDILLRSIRSVLGSDLMEMPLQAEYAMKKRANPFVFRPYGKTEDEPGILSGALYNSLYVSPTSSGVTVGIGAINSGTRAVTFQRVKDTAAYLRGVEARDAARNPNAVRVPNEKFAALRRVQLIDYARVINERSHFMQKGVAIAMPQLVKALEESLVHAISISLNGGSVI